SLNRFNGVDDHPNRNFGCVENQREATVGPALATDELGPRQLLEHLDEISSRHACRFSDQRRGSRQGLSRKMNYRSESIFYGLREHIFSKKGYFGLEIHYPPE